jgi:plastocyanin
MNVRHTLAALACVALAPLALVLPGSATAAPAAARTGPHTWHVLVGAQGAHQAIQTMGYYPRHIWVDQGDTVVWSADSAEIHTVTFLGHGTPCPADSLCAVPPQGFNPGDPVQSTPHGSQTYDGSSYYSSGLLTTAHGDTGPLPPFVHVVRSYRLVFPADLAPGTYWYLCLVHGRMQVGSVTVQPAGSPYPFTQRDYDARARHGISKDIADGHRLWARARRQARRLSHGHARTVLNGVMDARAMIMRFVPSVVTIHRGQQVRFLASSMGEPHTVTFGNDETGCGRAPCNPEQPWNVVPTPDGNLRATYPARNGGFTGSPRALNSGLMMGLPPQVTHLANRLVVRFVSARRFRFACALHDYMGMTGVVRVRR